MASKLATYRLPEDLVQEIRYRAEATNRDRTAVVIEALRQAFGFPPEQPRSGTVEALQGQLNALEKELATLRDQLGNGPEQRYEERHTRHVNSEERQTVAQKVCIPYVEPKSNSGISPIGTFAFNNTFRPQEGSQAQTLRVHEQQVEGEVRWDRKIAQHQPDETELGELAVRFEAQARIFDQILSASTDPICVIDRMGRHTYVNKAFAQLLGLEQAQILGKTMQQLDLQPEVSQSLDAQRELVFAVRRPLKKEISYATNNGDRDYEYILSPILGHNGTVEAMLCTARDITERKQVEQSLRESEANYRHLFEYANDSIFILDMETSRILDANQNASRRLGYTRQELLKLSTREIDAEISDATQKRIQQQMHTSGCVVFEHALRCKDGTDVQVEVSSRLIEYRDQLVSLSFARDITERKQAEAAFRKSEEQFRKIFENAPIGISLVDLETYQLLQVNPALGQLLGYTHSELTALTCLEITDPEDREKVLQHLKQLESQEGGSYQLEVRYLKKNQEVVWVSLTSSTVCTLQGKPALGLGMIKDITERKQLEAALCQAQATSEQRAAALERANQALQFALEEFRVAEELCLRNVELRSAPQLGAAERQRYRDLSGCAPIGYVVTDMAGIIQKANRVIATLLATEPDVLIGKPLSVFIPLEDWQTFRTQLSQLQERQQVDIFELNLKLRQGEPLLGTVTVSAKTDACGKLLGFHWLIQEATVASLVRVKRAM